MGLIVSIAKNLIDPKFQLQPEPEQCLGAVASWLENCLSDNHPECLKMRNSGRSRLKPTRLLFLDDEQPDRIRLVSVMEGESYNYATLSHRWGNPEPPKLSERKPGHERDIHIKALETGIAISDIPSRTFREAIQITRHCKLRYIWIDCLCIVQGENSEGRNLDWEMEAGKMADIYAGGAFNIAVTHARNSEKSLFPVRRDIITPVVRAPVVKETIVLWLDCEEKFRRDVEYSELLSRGWVYQEVLLTPANLFCTAKEMWWSCSHTTLSQSFPRGAVNVWGARPYEVQFNNDDEVDAGCLCADIFRQGKQSMQTPEERKSPTRGLDLWSNVVLSYTRTSVTAGDDRLVAIAGVANLFSTLFPKELQISEYNAGVWSTPGSSDGLISQLSWRGLSFPDRPYSAPRHPIPSWSPMSFPGEVQNILWPCLLPINLINLGSSQLDSFGRATEKAQCILHIQGVLMDVHIALVFKDELNGDGSAYISDHGLGPVSINWDSKEERQLAAESDPMAYARLLVLELDLTARRGFVGLLLRPLDGLLSADGHRVWVRCGFAICDLWTKRSPEHLRHVEDVFQVRKYGVTWVKDEHKDEARKITCMFGSWQKVSEPHGLQDIYIA